MGPISPVATLGASFIAQVLPTNRPPGGLQGMMDTFTSQYAPETYAVALGGIESLVETASSAQPAAPAAPPVTPTEPSFSTILPTFDGTKIPLIDHELEKISAAYQGNATLTPPLPTFAAQH